MPIQIYSSHLSLASVSFLLMRFSLLTEQAEIRRLMMPREVGWDTKNKAYLELCRYQLWKIMSFPRGGRYNILRKFWFAHPTKICVSGILEPGSTLNNPEFFPDPPKFNPLRFEEMNISTCTFVPFGAGPLMYPEKEYARVTILVFLHYVVTMFKWEPILAAWYGTCSSGGFPSSLFSSVDLNSSFIRCFSSHLDLLKLTHHQVHAPTCLEPRAPWKMYKLLCGHGKIRYMHLYPFSFHYLLH